ncbi:hypothetical protein [Azospirillum sp. B506]|nr:hypothetical protein [Azospirillum sp. B506]
MNTDRVRSPLAASAASRIAVAILLCALLWLTVGWALEWGGPA